jgi:hypothetical protein
MAEDPKAVEGARMILNAARKARGLPPLLED